MSANTKGILLVSVPVLFEIGFVAILALMLQSATQEFDRMASSREVLLHTHNLLQLSIRNVMTILRKDIPTAEQLKTIDQSTALLDAEEALAPAIKQTHPELSNVLIEQHELREKMLVFVSNTRRLISNPSISYKDRSRYFDTSGGIMIVMDFENATKHLIAAEKQLRDAEPEQLNKFRLTTAFILISGLATTCLISAFMAKLFTFDTTARLKVITGNAHALSNGKVLSPRMDGTDEIAQLDLALHESSEILMAARAKELAILDNAADVICSVGEDLKFQAVGASSQTAWKQNPADLIGSSLLSLVSRRTVNATRQAFQQLTFDSIDGSVEIEMPSRDGSNKRFLWTVAWSPKERTYVCVAHDVTELRAIEQMKQSLVSMASHDLRTPITSVGLGLSSLRSGKRGHLSRAAQNLVESAQNSVGQLMTVVNGLLELDKMESGHLVLNEDCLSASEICIAASEAVEMSAVLAGVTIIEPVGDAAVKGDEQRLIQVVSNLLTNAIKSSRKGGTVQMSISHNDGMVEISVIDEGADVSEDQHRLMFDKFNLSKSAPNLSSSSAGFSLAVVKAIIGAHEGTSGARTNDGSGSIFWIRLPEFGDNEAE